MTDAEVKAGLTALHVVGLTLYGEGSGEPLEGKVFIGCNIRNRVTDAAKRWSRTFEGVCLQPRQFSCWEPDFGGEKNYARVMERARMFVGDFAERPNLMDPVLRECLYLAEGIITDKLLDFSKGSNHYMTIEQFRTAPKWAKGKIPIIAVGHHVGFKL